ncbi:MAG: translesion error-prone DNA polymerase V autoproteolytic subunit [Fibrobacterota bacterium]
MKTLRRLKSIGNFQFYTSDISSHVEVPLSKAAVSAGFPSPAEDYLEMKLDLNKHIVKHPAATFYVRVTGTSMIKVGIHDGDLLVVDRSLEPKDGAIAICLLNGAFTVKRLQKKGKKLYLQPENPDFKPIEVVEGGDFEVWGIVSFIIHQA